MEGTNVFARFDLRCIEPAKYVDLKKAQSEGDFLAERTSKNKHARNHSEGERLYKAGPRDIGNTSQSMRENMSLFLSV